MLKEYLHTLDSSSYDHEDVSVINSEFQHLIEKLIEEDNEDDARLADLNREVFSVNKSFDYDGVQLGTVRGLSYRVSSIQKMEDGSEVPLFWPDVTKYTDSDFQYFKERFLESTNLYVKTEYGLMVYFGAKTLSHKTQFFVEKLVAALFELSKEYYSKIKEKNSYTTYFQTTLKLALGIAKETKLDDKIDEIVQYIYETHQSLDLYQKFDVTQLRGKMSKMSAEEIDKQIDELRNEWDRGF